MVIQNKDQIEIEVDMYKRDGKINIIYPDNEWTKYHLNKSDYNLRMARINLNLNKHPDIIKKLVGSEPVDPLFNTFEWVIIMSYYAMFHSVNALLRKIGLKVGKEYTHEITTNLLLYYFYYTKIIEDELLKFYENAERKAREMVVSYIHSKEKRREYQYEANKGSEEKEASQILDNAVNFVTRLKDIEKILSKELVLKRLNKTSL